MQFIFLPNVAELQWSNAKWSIQLRSLLTSVGGKSSSSRCEDKFDFLSLNFFRLGENFKRLQNNWIINFSSFHIFRAKLFSGRLQCLIRSNYSYLIVGKLLLIFKISCKEKSYGIGQISDENEFPLDVFFSLSGPSLQKTLIVVWSKVKPIEKPQNWGKACQTTKK